MYEALEMLPEYTPDYVVDEIAYYSKKISSGKSDVFTLDNAILLVNLAVINFDIMLASRVIYNRKYMH